MFFCPHSQGKAALYQMVTVMFQHAPTTPEPLFVTFCPLCICPCSQGKAALYQKVTVMYQHVLHLDTTSRIFLEPFNYSQTKELMQVGRGTG